MDKVKELNLAEPVFYFHMSAAIIKACSGKLNEAHSFRRRKARQ